MDATLKPTQEPRQPKKKQIKHLWNAEENERFLEGLRKYGEKGIKEIAEYIGTRNPAQVRSHLQKYKLKNPLPKVILPAPDPSADKPKPAVSEKEGEGKKKASKKSGKDARKEEEKGKDK